MNEIIVCLFNHNPHIESNKNGIFHSSTARLVTEFNVRKCVTFCSYIYKGLIHENENSFHLIHDFQRNALKTCASLNVSFLKS